MMQIKIQNATCDSFQKYGQIVELNPSEVASIKTPQVSFWKHQASYFIEGNTEIGVLKLKRTEMIISELENHFITPTLLIPLTGDFVMAVTAPADAIPNADNVVAFHFKKDQVVVLEPKVWHGSIFPVNDEEIILLVIFEENSLEKDTVWKLLDEPCILIK